MAWGALVDPTVWFPNVRPVGLTVTGARPVPDSEMDCGLSAALSVIVTAPVRCPATVGVNVTEIVHLAFGATVAPQSFVAEKSPLATMPDIVSGAVPLFVNVTVCGALVVKSTCAFLKVMLFDDSVTAGPF